MVKTTMEQTQLPKTFNAQMRRKAKPAIAPRRAYMARSIGGHVLPGLDRAHSLGRSGPANVGRPITHPKKQVQDVTPTWSGEFADDNVHPAGVPSRVPITAGGVNGRNQQPANAFRFLGDNFGARA